MKMTVVDITGYHDQSKDGEPPHRTIVTYEGEEHGTKFKLVIDGETDQESPPPKHGDVLNMELGFHLDDGMLD